jgi:hypothetical protein
VAQGVAVGTEEITMSWYRFWKAGESGTDRFVTVALTMVILRAGGYLHIDWGFIIYWYAIAFVLSLITGALKSYCEPDEA